MDERPSPIAGQWYSAHPASLAHSVDEFLNAVPANAPRAILGVVVPHAGHKYSGAVAAYAFAPLRGLELETVVIVCPSHYHDDGVWLTSGHAAYLTPLGAVPVNRDVVANLSAELAPVAPLVAIRRDQEHAIEIELPFLQRVLTPGFTLAPIMLRDQSEPLARALGEALAKVLRGQRALIVASSDLSHFQTQAVALKLDALMLDQIEAFDPERVLAVELEAEEKLGVGLACGYGAIAATLWAARALGATRTQVVKHATSADASGDYERVVGYGAALIFKE